MPNFVEPGEIAIDQYLQQEICKLGFPDELVSWLMELFQDPECFQLWDEPGSDPADSRKEILIGETIKALEESGKRKHQTYDAVVVDVIQTLLSLADKKNNKFITDPWQQTADSRKLKSAWILRFQKLDIDWAKGLACAGKRIQITHELGVAIVDILSPNHFIWTELINADTAHEYSEKDEYNPEKIIFWMIAFTLAGQPSHLGNLENIFQKNNQHLHLIEVILKYCLYFSRPFANYGWIVIKEEVSDPEPNWKIAVDSILRFIENNFPFIFDRKDKSNLRFLWMKLRFELELDRSLHFAPDTLVFYRSEEERVLLLNTAYDAIGLVRNSIRETQPQLAKQKFLEHFFLEAVIIADKLGTPWRATKACLLAFREVRYLAVTEDLRYWTELEFKSPPNPWNLIPSTLAEQIRYHHKHPHGDERLEKIRTNFAEFFFERLKRKEIVPEGQLQGEICLVEQDPIWRNAFVRALRELGVNPGGRGHHVLHHVLKSDPDNDVRDQAKRTYDILRRNEGLPAKISPLTALFAAFWWLRQAHVMTLGGTVDQAGATRTRSKEVRHHLSHVYE